MRRFLLYMLMAFFGLSAAATSPLPALQVKMSPGKEYRAKAKTLYNLAKLTTWPDDILPPGKDFNLCILGTDPFGLALELLAIRRIGGRAVTIRRLETGGEAKGCHLIFLAKDVSTSKETVLHDLAAPGRLLVGDTPGFASRGGVVNLFVDGAGIGFEINIAAARRASLILNTQLLRLGQLIRENDTESADP